MMDSKQDKPDTRYAAAWACRWRSKFSGKEVPVEQAYGATKYIRRQRGFRPARAIKFMAINAPLWPSYPTPAPGLSTILDR
jgi:hypothetical protein